MKKLIVYLAAIVLSSFALQAQNNANDNTLMFMGKPIDGTKEAMIKALQADGFEYYSLFDYLRGMFNGESVTVEISTNHSIVDRIIVEYPSYSATNDTRVKYNMLLSRYNRNEKYICVNPRNEIPASANIYGMIRENSKFYDTVFFSLKPGTDTNQWCAIFKEEYEMLYDRQLKGLSYEEMEEALFCLPARVSEVVNGAVWFTINNSCNIVINYINFKNRPSGEDL